MRSKNVEVRIIRGEEIGWINRARCSCNCHVKHGRFVQVALFDIDRVYRRVLRVTVRLEKSWFKWLNYFVPRRLCRSVLPISPWLSLSPSYILFSVLYYSSVRSPGFVPLCPFLLPGLYNIRSLIFTPDRDFLEASSEVPENCSLVRYDRYLGKKFLLFFSVIGIADNSHDDNKLQIADSRGDF